MSEVILSNQAKCLFCGDTPWSAHVHDFRYCMCGSISVDGGMEYIKRGGDFTLMEDMSIVISEEHYLKLVEAIEDPTRNTLGHICNLVRVLRDDMGVEL